MKYQSNLNLLIVLLLVSISLAGCAQSTVAPTEVATEVATSTPEPPSATAADLEGKLWKLDSYVNSQGESVDVLPDTEITIEFKDGQVGGSGGCNNYFGSYEVGVGNTLSIGAIGSTEMACLAEGVMKQEQRYFEALASAASYQVTERKLQLANADGETVLSFSVLEPESLTGTTWRLTGYNNGQGGFVSLLRGTEITALFGDDGNLTGSAGCNNYTASYEVEGETISIGPAAATRMMCAKPEGIMEQESAYLSMLESAAAYQIRGDALKMLDADGEHLLSYTAETEIGMANLASVHCKEQGGRLEIRTADDGGQYGVCIFPDGSECEEWAFFRGECVPASASSLSLEALKNATYPSEWGESGAITLTDGGYEGDPFVEGGASRPIVILVEPVAFGDLDGDGVEDAAVILAANAGGSGTFISLEAVRNEGGEPVHVATYSLGDRARIESLAIEGGQIVLEMITHGPDDPLCCPTQLVRNVYALEGDTLIEVSSEVIGAVEEPSKPTAQLTLEALQNASYQGIYDEPVQLTDGRYEGEPFVPGGASRPTVVLHPEVYAFGDLNGNGVDDAVVILIENSGGSGNFRYLAAVINEGGAPMNVATQFVGDREQAQTITIDGNEITLDMVAHGPDDPLCCPTQEATKRYQLRDDQLVELFEFAYDFENDAEGWVVGFADLPADYEEDIFELDSGHRELPSGLEGGGIYIQGHNRSDDLFMFLKRQVDGLKPEISYQVSFRIDLATNVPAGLVGIGGSPGESVFVKAGATAIEPLVEEDASGYLRMNIDKGNQGGEGKDMINLGDIAHPELGEAAGEEYKIKTLNSAGRSFEVVTDVDGGLWFIVGTDSGFEGLTALYYSQISVILIEAN